jgi:C-terminal processing protease CtpA/Prc
MRSLILLLFAAMTLPAAHAESAAVNTDFNPFADAYVEHRQAPPTAQQEPRIYAGRDQLEDYQSMLEEGYDLLGYSSFEAGSVPPERLTSHAKTLRADVAMIYSTGKRRLPNADSLPKDADPTLYEYFVSYWTKLPTPLLGLHVQPNRQTDDGGLQVLAVIRQSPAAQAGMQSGDVLIQLGGTTMQEPGQLVETTRRLAGQTVDVDFVRDGSKMHQTVMLNALR